MTTAMPIMPVSIEQLAIAIRQMSLADRKRLLDLAPELRETATSQPRTLQEARASAEYTQAVVQTVLGNERLSADTPFINGFTLGQYLDLPDERRARMWDRRTSMTLIVRSAAEDAITIPLRLMNALKLREGDEVKAIVDGEMLRLAHLDQFLSLRGALADDEGFDEALKANQQGWQAWTKAESA
ncbi:MAG: AbrB/MazE/SpoVT family DNA-binding domain-containing protein [Chloroflexi bacterium]|nr:AbrB/MazE/SpoVT family DNA-binding domain-containing protein [Chloroflexota bacterium]